MNFIVFLVIFLTYHYRNHIIFFLLRTRISDRQIQVFKYGNEDLSKPCTKAFVYDTDTTSSYDYSEWPSVSNVFLRQHEDLAEDGLLDHKTIKWFCYAIDTTRTKWFEEVQDEYVKIKKNYRRKNFNFPLLHLDNDKKIIGLENFYWGIVKNDPLLKWLMNKRIYILSIKYLERRNRLIKLDNRFSNRENYRISSLPDISDKNPISYIFRIIKLDF